MRGIRARLTVTLVALVALTAVLLGAGAYLFVDIEPPRPGACATPRSQAGFDLSVTVPGRDLPPDPDPRRRHRQRPARDVPPAPRSTRSSTSATASPWSRTRILSVHYPPAAGRPFSRVDSGRARASRGRRSGEPRSSSAAGRRGGPTFYFVHDVAALEDALGQLRLALGVGCSSSSSSPFSSPGSSPVASSPRSRPPAGPPSGSNTATCPPACRSPRTTSSGRGPSASTGWPPRSPTRSGGSRRRGPEPAVRRRCCARAADAPHGTRGRGVDPARAPRRAAGGEPTSRRAPRRGRRAAAHARR